eukprot:COSAG06_NODE_6243_length_3018_cov_4.183967_2_plen_74_part_00
MWEERPFDGLRLLFRDVVMLIRIGRQVVEQDCKTTAAIFAQFSEIFQLRIADLSVSWQTVPLIIKYRYHRRVF